MADIVHPKKLDRTREFGQCLGDTSDGVLATQDGYGFDGAGNCIKVYPEAPDYAGYLAGDYMAFAERANGRAPAPGQAGASGGEAPPGDPNVPPDQVSTTPAPTTGGPAPFAGLSWGGQEAAQPAQQVQTPAPPPPPRDPLEGFRDPAQQGEADDIEVIPPMPPEQEPPAAPAAAEGSDGEGDGGNVDDEGPIDPELAWNDLQKAMRERGLPRPQNKEDAKRILEDAGLLA